ncbi:MAG: hypothetical protein KME45_19500 [Stenomitos rutilans HA7619-LM2]|jgi:hypothetical protein|nr:hypothetical protein [Stenomitos rutilans HA7619-LM2]
MDFDILPPSIRSVLTETSPQISSQMLKQILADPTLLEQLSDRVYTLLKHELNHQRERSQGYGRRF